MPRGLEARRKASALAHGLEVLRLAGGEYRVTLARRVLEEELQVLTLESTLLRLAGGEYRVTQAVRALESTWATRRLWAGGWPRVLVALGSARLQLSPKSVLEDEVIFQAHKLGQRGGHHADWRALMPIARAKLEHTTRAMHAAASLRTEDV